MSSELKNPEFHARLVELMGEESTKKPFAWAARVGISKGAFDRIWNDGTVPSADLLIRISARTGVSIDWLLTGQGPMYLQPSGESAISINEHGGQGAAPADGLDKDFVLIPVVEGKISAGGGLVPDNTIELTIAFKREWIARKGDHRAMSIIRVRGDSMEPTLLDGDIILVNHGDKVVNVNGGIYAVAFRDEIMVKRIEVLFPEGKLKLISDNGRYSSYVADPQDVVINGKVIWYGRDLER
jgi:phage repressor protein C with HTH and peptisase S24 domain